jgi:hypothetical protein
VVNIGEQAGKERVRFWERSRMEEYIWFLLGPREHRVGGEDG